MPAGIDVALITHITHVRNLLICVRKKNIIMFCSLKFFPLRVAPVLEAILGIVGKIFFRGVLKNNPLLSTPLSKTLSQTLGQV